MDIYLSAFILLIFLLFAFKKWALKGEFLHPAFIYLFINGGLFLIFAFGPYRYNYNLSSSYYYMYALVIGVFVGGIILGDFKGRKKRAKSINSLINNKSYLWYLLLMIFYGILLMPLLFLGLDPEQIADNYHNEVNAASSSFSIVNFIITNITTSLLQIGTALVTSHALLKPKKYYRRIVIIILCSIAYSFLTGSRTRLVLFLIPVLVPIYTKYQERIKFPWENKNFKKIILASVLAIIGLMIAITNIRTLSNSLPGYVIIEGFFPQIGLERKIWFPALETLPDSLVTIISLISIYAGSTIIHGGIVTDIVLEKGIFTLGLRNFFPIHRVLSQLNLDFGLSEVARTNLYKVQELGQQESLSMLSGWYGSPGNMILDIGYIGAPLIAGITGYAIGWLYGRIFQSGTIIKSIGISILTISLILTPAAGPFALFSNFINLFLLGLHLTLNSTPLKKIRINYLLVLSHETNKR